MVVPTGRARVLVIEDEPVVAETLAIVFSNAGYETRKANSAESALALLELEKWIPQFAIIDVHLPGMNGIDLAIMLKAQYPDLPVSLFSGRAETAELIEEANKQGHSFDVLAKPVHPTLLLQMAYSFLGGAGPNPLLM